MNADEAIAACNGIIVKVLDCYRDDVTPTAVLDDPPLNVSRFERAELAAVLEEHFGIDSMLADDDWMTVGDIHADLLTALDADHIAQEMTDNRLGGSAA